jgi:hypothetical protein
MVEIDVHSQRRVSGGSSGGFGRISSGGTAASAVSGLAGIASNLITAGIKKSGEDRFERWVGRTEEALAQARANGAGNAEREGMLRTLISESNLTGKHRMAARKAISIQQLTRTRLADGSVVQSQQGTGNVISNTLGANAEQGKFAGEVDSANRQVAQVGKAAPRASKAYESFITSHLDDPTKARYAEQTLNLAHSTNDLMTYINGKNRGIIFKGQPMVNISEIGNKQSENFAQLKNRYEMMVNDLDRITGSLLGEEVIIPKMASGQVLKAIEADIRQSFMQDGVREAFGMDKNMKLLDDMFNDSQDRSAQWSTIAFDGGFTNSLVELDTLRNTHATVINSLREQGVIADLPPAMLQLKVMFPIIQSLGTLAGMVLKGEGGVAGRNALIADAISLASAPMIRAHLDEIEDTTNPIQGHELIRKMKLILITGSTYGDPALVERIKRTIGPIIKKANFKNPKTFIELEKDYITWLGMADSISRKIEDAKKGN